MHLGAELLRRCGNIIPLAEAQQVFTEMVQEAKFYDGKNYKFCQVKYAAQYISTLMQGVAIKKHTFHDIVYIGSDGVAERYYYCPHCGSFSSYTSGMSVMAPLFCTACFEDDTGIKVDKFELIRPTDTHYNAYYFMVNQCRHEEILRNSNIIVRFFKRFWEALTW